MAISTRKPGDTAPAVKQSANAAATGTTNSTRPIPGSHYTAKVLSRQDDGTYTVALEDPQQELNGVRLAMPVLGGMFGLNVRCTLPVNTHVKLAFGNPSFIFCVLPENNADWLNSQNRSLLWGTPMDKEQGVKSNVVSSHAEDLLEGEVELNNLFGVALEFLTTIIRMKAADRAVVECHLINDMVRVICSQFRHISGMGEDLIYDHGRPTMERGWSSYRHEVLGIEKEKEPFAELNGGEINRQELEATRVNGLGRMRLREFIGFAGDFIHSFISDPPKAIVSLGQGSSAASGAGKSWVHRNSDGSIIMQSVADIRLERVCRIPVAYRYKHHEDPNVTKFRAYEALEKDFLKLPAAINPVETGDVYQAAYHIRSYARWLGRYHAFARMLQMSDEYIVPAESEVPVPDWRNRELDRSNENARDNYPDTDGDSSYKALYYDAYACVTIMRDGSIVLYDGYGSSVMMSNGNVQISASRHIDLEAAGDIRVRAGGSIYMKARRNIEFSAVMGGIVMHAYAWLKAICEKGTVWFRSNAVTDKDAEFDGPKAPGMPIPEVAGKVFGNKHGLAVLIEAAEGHAAFRSQMGMAVVVDGNPTDTNDGRYNLDVSTNGNLDMRGQRLALLRSSTRTALISGGDLLLSGFSVLSNASEFIIGRSLENPDFVMRGGLLWAPRLYAGELSGQRIIGPERGPRIKIPDQQPTLSLKQHVNHIDVFANNVAPPSPGGATTAQVDFMRAVASTAALPPNVPWSNPSDGPLWGFPDSTEYVWDNREKTPAGIPETLTQQHLRLDAVTDQGDRWGGDGYVDWLMDSKVVGTRIRPSGGFGSYEVCYRASDEGDSLHAPAAKRAELFSDVKIEWRPVSNPAMKALRRPEEE